MGQLARDPENRFVLCDGKFGDGLFGTAGEREKLRAVETMIEECKEEAVTLSTALEKGKLRLLSKALEDKMTQLDERYAKLEIRQQEVETALEAKITDATIEEAVTFAQAVRLGLGGVNREAKQKILDIFDAKGTVKGGRVFIEYTLSSLPIEFHPYSVL